MRDIARFDWTACMKASANFPDAHRRALDSYFSHFCAVEIKDNADGKPEFQPQPCVNCGETLTGMMAFFGRGGFEWGIRHGEGHCAKCKWPAVGHHFIKDEDGKEVVTLHNFILQVHPDFVSKREREPAS